MGKEKKYDFYIDEIVDMTKNDGVFGYALRKREISCSIAFKDNVVDEFKRVLDKILPLNSE